MDPGQSSKPLSQDQGFHEDWSDEHKSLPHFSFLLFKVDVALDFWSLRIPLVVRIHLNLSQQQLVYLCDCTLSPTVSQLHALPRAQGTTVSTGSFSRGYDPSTHARRMYLSVSLSLSCSPPLLLSFSRILLPYLSLLSPLFFLSPPSLSLSLSLSLLSFLPGSALYVSEL